MRFLDSYKANQLIQYLSARWIGVAMITIAISIGQISAQAQGKLKYYSRDSSSYIGFVAAAQFWLRHAQHNPGTMINSLENDHSTDLSMRRLRLAAYGKFNPRTNFFVLFGRNDFNQLNDKASIGLLDLTIDYEITNWLSLGVGKNAWRGPSRFSAPSITKLLTLDVPVSSLTTVNLTDDLTRRLGMYTKGQFKGLDYRLALSRPFNTNTNALGSELTFVPESDSWQSSGYLKYQFLDKEAQVTPYSVGTYLGSKEVFNVGIGFEHQPDLLWKSDGVDTTFTDFLSYAVDVFYEKPLAGSGRVLTLYGTYFNHDYGSDYIRNVGLNAIATGTNDQSSFNGKGTAYPVIGTGDGFMVNAAMLFRNPTKEKAIGYQPYFASQWSDFDTLDENMIHYDAGINIYLNGHWSKFTLSVQNRPVYDLRNDRLKVVDRLNTVILQYQFRID